MVEENSGKRAKTLGFASFRKGPESHTWASASEPQTDPGCLSWASSPSYKCLLKALLTKAPYDQAMPVLPKRNESKLPHRDCTQMCPARQNSQRVEATPMCISWWTKRGLYTQWAITLQLKGIKYWSMWQHRWTSKALKLSEKCQTQTLHIAWFHLDEIFRMGNSIDIGSKLAVT